MISLDKWTDWERREAVKNLLHDKTCDSCINKYDCPIVNNKYKTCYEYEYNEMENVFRLVGSVSPSLISKEIIPVQPMSGQSGTIYHLKPCSSSECDEDKHILE